MLINYKGMVTVMSEFFGGKWFLPLTRGEEVTSGLTLT